MQSLSNFHGHFDTIILEGHMAENYMIHPELDGSSFTCQGGTTGFLLLHGFTATTTEVRPLGERLCATGHTVSAPLLPGHGTHPDDLNKIRWQDWLQIVESEYHKLSEECEEVWVAGESMGGLLCLLLAAKNPNIKGLLLYAPALYVNKMNAAYVLQYVMKYLAKKPKKEDLPWKGYNVYPLKGAVEMLKLQKAARKALGKITQPTLAFFSEKDATVNLAASDLLKEKLGSKDLEIVILKESPHVILLANEQQKVIGHTVNYLTNHLNR
jgi:carboxylesterase